jgi:hypothetical protein
LQVRSDDEDICDKLAADGILSRLEPLTYKIPSKFIRTIVLNAYAPYAKNLQTEIMLDQDGNINSRKLIEYVSPLPHPSTCFLLNLQAQFAQF